MVTEYYFFFDLENIDWLPILVSVLNLVTILSDSGDCATLLNDSISVGDHIEVGDKQGILIASSRMGVTIFDLFGEILSQEDLKTFTSSHGMLGLVWETEMSCIFWRQRGHYDCSVLMRRGRQPLVLILDGNALRTQAKNRILSILFI